MKRAFLKIFDERFSVFQKLCFTFLQDSGKYGFIFLFFQNQVKNSSIDFFVRKCLKKPWQEVVTSFLTLCTEKNLVFRGIATRTNANPLTTNFKLQKAFQKILLWPFLAEIRKFEKKFRFKNVYANYVHSGYFQVHGKDIMEVCNLHEENHFLYIWFDKFK